MNTDLLDRDTFVIDSATSERLTVIAERMGVSRSALVRDVLAEPVELMHRWVSALPANDAMTPESVAELMGQIETDIGEFIDAKSAQLDLLGEPSGGNA